MGANMSTPFNLNTLAHHMWKKKWIAVLLWIAAGSSLIYWLNYERNAYIADAIVKVGYTVDDQNRREYFEDINNLEEALLEKYISRWGRRCKIWAEIVVDAQIRFVCRGRDRQEVRTIVQEMVDGLVDRHKGVNQKAAALADAEKQMYASHLKLTRATIARLRSKQDTESRQEGTFEILRWLAHKDLLDLQHKQNVRGIEGSGVPKTALLENSLVADHRKIGSGRLATGAVIILLFGLLGALVASVVDIELGHRRDTPD